MLSKKRVGCLSIFLIFIIVVVGSLMNVLTRPKIVIVSFEYYPHYTYYGLVTLQNVGGKGHVIIYDGENEILFDGTLYAGQVFKVQTGWWALGTLKVVYDDGRIDYLSLE